MHDKPRFSLMFHAGIKNIIFTQYKKQYHVISIQNCHKHASHDCWMQYMYLYVCYIANENQNIWSIVIIPFKNRQSSSFWFCVISLPLAITKHRGHWRQVRYIRNLFYILVILQNVDILSIIGRYASIIDIVELE